MNMTDEIKQYILATFGEDMLKQIEARADDLAQQAKAVAASGVRFKSAAPASDFWGFPVSGHSEDDRQTMASHYSAQNSQYDPMWPGMRIPAQKAKKQAVRGKFDTFWLIPVAAQSKVGTKAKSMPWAQNYTPAVTPRPAATKSVGMGIKDLSHDDKILVRRTLSAVFGNQDSTRLITEHWDSPSGLAAIVELLDRFSP